MLFAATIQPAAAQDAAERALEGVAARDAMCALNRGLAEAGRFDGLAAAAENPVVALNAVQTFQCYGLFSIVADHAPAPELQSIGKQLTQTGTAFILLDMFATGAGAQSATFSAVMEFDDVSWQASARYFWLKHHATAIAQEQNLKLAATGEARDHLQTIARCFAVVEAMQAHVRSIPFAETAFAQAAELESADPEMQARTLEEGRNLMFGYRAPDEAAVAGNLEVAARLAPVVKLSLMKWQEAGSPQPVLYAERQVELARRGLDSFCPGTERDALTK